MKNVPFRQTCTQLCWKAAPENFISHGKDAVTRSSNVPSGLHHKRLNSFLVAALHNFSILHYSTRAMLFDYCKALYWVTLMFTKTQYFYEDTQKQRKVTNNRFRLLQRHWLSWSTLLTLVLQRKINIAHVSTMKRVSHWRSEPIPMTTTMVIQTQDHEINDHPSRPLQ